MMITEHMLCQPSIFQSYPGVAAAASTRLGGVSEGPYTSLNLGLNTGDQPEAVQENRKRFFQALGFSLQQSASAFQVHGDAILHVREHGRWDGYDALITNQPGIVLSVTVADCTPILVLDPVRRAVAAIHAGWKGTAAQIAHRTIRQMQTLFQTHPKDCLAYIGPCIDECSFEVDVDVAQYFQEPFVRWSPEQQKYLIDLKQANKSQLLDAGLADGHIEVSPLSTVLHNDLFFSHRKEKGKTGRMLNVIGFLD